MNHPLRFPEELTSRFDCQQLRIDGGMLRARRCIDVVVAGGFFVNLSLQVAAAVLQSSALNRMRGLVTLVYALVLSYEGLGLAPTLVALVTDKILHEPKAVGVALGCVCAGGGVVAVAAEGEDQAGCCHGLFAQPPSLHLFGF